MEKKRAVGLEARVIFVLKGAKLVEDDGRIREGATKGFVPRSSGQPVGLLAGGVVELAVEELDGEGVAAAAATRAEE